VFVLSSEYRDHSLPGTMAALMSWRLSICQGERLIMGVVVVTKVIAGGDEVATSDICHFV